MWAIALHGLFLCSELPIPRPPPSDWLRLFFEPNLSRIIPHIPTPVMLHNYSPMKMEQTEYSETLAFKLQTPLNHPEESVQRGKFSSQLNAVYT
jgi:hypothetical protein